ncbi:MAG: hypothetical protein U9R12_05740 [Candidatus Caldatribacteriota bacterium]|nr:hypothetical protein [Candidatus Caldatribacteriota bacterium]
MKKAFYQIVYKDYGRLESDYNQEVSQKIFEREIEAWKYVLLDCENDDDIAYMLANVSSGAISLKKVLLEDEAT